MLSHGLCAGTSGFGDGILRLAVREAMSGKPLTQIFFIVFREGPEHFEIAANEP